MNKTEQPINQDLGKDVEYQELREMDNTDTLQVNEINETSISQITDDGSADLGKFKDVQSLIKAYNSLQTEFTKKSQRLSELENSKTEFSREEKINQAIIELEQMHNNASKYANSLKQKLKNVETENYALKAQESLLQMLDKDFKTADEYINDEQFLKDYVYSNQQIRDNIIKQYLANLTNTTPVKVVSNISSSIPLSPPNVPTTIKEAGNLAKNIIKQV